MSIPRMGNQWHVVANTLGNTILHCFMKPPSHETPISWKITKEKDFHPLSRHASTHGVSNSQGYSEACKYKPWHHGYMNGNLMSQSFL